MLKLKSKGVYCYNSSWQAFLKSQWNQLDMADLIITEPPPAQSRSPIHSMRLNSDINNELSIDEVKQSAQEFKRVLKPGGFTIIIMPFFHSWNGIPSSMMRDLM